MKEIEGKKEVKLDRTDYAAGIKVLLCGIFNFLGRSIGYGGMESLMLKNSKIMILMKVINLGY